MREHSRLYAVRKYAADPEHRERVKKRVRDWVHTDRGHAIRRRRNLRKNYGITPEEKARLLSSQNGGCAICRKALQLTGPDCHVDHDHSSKAVDGSAVRGLLCGLCNMGLGKFHDSPALLRAAAAYLEAHESRKARLAAHADGA